MQLIFHIFSWPTTTLTWHLEGICWCIGLPYGRLRVLRTKIL